MDAPSPPKSGVALSRDEMKKFVARIQKNLRVTKVIATRSIKGRGGDTFAGFSAAWNTVQSDGDEGSLVEEETSGAQSVAGMTLPEARVAMLVVACAADVAAHQNAMANGSMSADYGARMIKTIRINYNRMIAEVLGVENGDET
jgi:hypothetical protein